VGGGVGVVGRRAPAKQKQKQKRAQLKKKATFIYESLEYLFKFSKKQYFWFAALLKRVCVHSHSGENRLCRRFSCT
jgi:hypothetical protein